MKKRWITIILSAVFLLTAIMVSATMISAFAASKYPELVEASPSADGVTLSWNTYPGAVQYRIFYRTPNGWRGIGYTTGTSFTHRTPENGTTYRYTVRALDADGVYCSGFDGEGLTVTYRSTPTLGKVTNGVGGQTLTWTPVSGAKRYRVYIKLRSSTSWRSIGVTTSTSFFCSGLQAGTPYTYTVQCVASDGKTPQSWYDESGIAATYVAAPEITSVRATENGVEISWGAVKGAYQYRLFYRTPEGWKAITTTTETSGVHTNLINNTAYRYTVRCLNANGIYNSSFLSAGVTFTYHSAPVLSQVTNSYGGQTVSWNPVEGAEQYGVYVKDGQSWKNIGVTEDTSLLYTEAQSGVTYTYTVRCVARDGVTLQSYFDRVGVSKAYVAAPEITGAIPAEDGLTLNWDAVSGAVQYRVFCRESSGWKGLTITEDTSFTHTGLSEGSAYTYTVRALDEKGIYCSGYCSRGWTYYYLMPPAYTVQSGEGGLRLNWNAAEGASGYRVCRREFGGEWTVLVDTILTTYIDESAPADAVYTYAVLTLDEKAQPSCLYPYDTQYLYQGEPANGSIDCNGTALLFVDGHVRQGYVTIGGKTYYYDENGTIVMDGIVGNEQDGYRYADRTGVIDPTARLGVSVGGVNWIVEDGIARQVVTAEDTAYFHALVLVDAITLSSDSMELKLRKCFDYLLNNTEEVTPRVPHYRGMDWPVVYAEDIFVNKKGNCFSNAASFAYMAKAIGYQDIFVCNSSYHGWAEIGGLIYDPEWQRNHYYSYYGVTYNSNLDIYYDVMQQTLVEPWQYIRIA